MPRAYVLAKYRTSTSCKYCRLSRTALCTNSAAVPAAIKDKDNLSRWWGEDRENPRDEPLSLDRALARSRREVHPEGFPILTSSTWLIIYLAYFLPKPHFNQMFFGLQSIWHIYRVGKCRLTSPSDVITTCVRTHSRTSNGSERRQEGFPIIVKSKDCPIWYTVLN